MWQLFLGSLLLGLIHPLFPNHWIPLIAISKTEKWTNKETIIATLITGFSHTLSTIIIGIIVGFVGIKLTENYSYITKIAAPLILVVIGVIYLLLEFRSTHHHHHFEIDNESLKNRKSKTAIILSLCIGMFFSPCIEIEAYYFQAATQGWIGIFLVSIMLISRKVNLNEFNAAYYTIIFNQNSTKYASNPNSISTTPVIDFSW